MSKKLTQGLILGGLGYFIGLSTGVAALGSAISGAFVFGPIGFLVGWLMTSRDDDVSPAPMVAEPQLPIDLDIDTPSPMIVERQLPVDLGIETPAPKGDYQLVEDSVSQIIPIVGRIAASVWNMQMKMLSAVGVMPYLVRHPWLLIGIGFALLAIIFPFGIIFTVTGFAAMHYGARPEDNFCVLSHRPKG